jgi:tetratricopeptide (TPR) repeat protein
VVAQVQGIEDGVLLRRLAQDLALRHRLVVEQAEVQMGRRRFSRFKFSHALVQNYLYRQLSHGERRLLHGQVAGALENCYGERVDEFAVQLSHHHSRAGNDRRALHYFTQSAENARRAHANEEARAHYTRAIEAAKSISADAASVVRLFLGRGRVNVRLGNFEGALADYEAALLHVGHTGDRELDKLQWRALVDLGKLWTSRDYQHAHDCFRHALRLSHQMGDPTLQAGSLNWIGNWFLNQEKPRAAIEHHQEAVEIL